jgi:hypothetical protein
MSFNHLKSFLVFGFVIMALGAEAQARDSKKNFTEQIEKHIKSSIKMKNSSDVNTDYCRVSNDQGQFIGNVSPNDFLEIASEYAEKFNLCTVTDVKQASGAQVLFDKDGYSLGEKLTQQEVAELQKSYGLSRCRVLTCEVRKASLDNIADGEIYSR